MSLQLVNHNTGASIDYDDIDAIETATTTKEFVKWHEARNLRPSFTVYEDGRIIRQVREGKDLEVPKAGGVSTGDVARAGAALEQRVEELEGKAQDHEAALINLGKTAATLSQQHDSMSSTLSTLQNELAARKATKSAQS